MALALVGITARRGPERPGGGVFTEQGEGAVPVARPGRRCPRRVEPGGLPPSIFRAGALRGAALGGPRPFGALPPAPARARSGSADSALCPRARPTSYSTTLRHAPPRQTFLVAISRAMFLLAPVSERECMRGHFHVAESSRAEPGRTEPSRTSGGVERITIAARYGLAGSARLPRRRPASSAQPPRPAPDKPLDQP